MIEQVQLVTTIAGYARKGQELGAALERLLGQTEEFIQKREQLDIEWWGELVQAVRQVESRLGQLERAEVKRRFLEDHEGIGVLANYVTEAYAEPLDERRRMWAHASAGMANLELTIAQHARVQRTLRELDPHDITALYHLFLIPNRPPSQEVRDRFQRVAINATEFSLRLAYWEEADAEALVSSGCVRLYEGGNSAGSHAGLALTQTGRMVLRALRSYVHGRTGDLQNVPGHEVTTEFRSEDEARSMIAGVPDLLTILHRGERLSFASFVNFDACDIAGGAPADGRAVLRMHLGTQEDCTRLQEVTTRVEATHGESVDRIYVDHIDHRPHDKVERYLHLAGPHDVLRWLAYDLDASWN